MVIESLTKLAEKATKAVEDIADKIDDEISNAMDKPVEPLPLEQQLLVGIPCGALLGAVVGRQSKQTMILVGGSLIIVTAANQGGFLDDVDKKQLKRDARSARRQLDDELRRRDLPTTNQINSFFKVNKSMSLSGLGAFLVGAAIFFK